MSFNDYSKYIFSFSRLDNLLPDISLQKHYYNKWMTKYSNIFKQDSTILQSMEWDLRCRKSLREIFSSATFFQEAKKNLEYKCFSSYYFSLYYSLFHAIYACIFLDTECKMSQLTGVTHRNIIKLFISAYGNTSKDIMSRQIENVFEELKYKREYYSYVTPFNNIFNITEDLNKLEPILLNCYQLAAMHSLFINTSYNKHIGSTQKIYSYEDKTIFEGMFNEFFAKKSPNNTFDLDSSCEYMKYEMLKYGIHPEYISIDLEHSFDEFHTYDNFYNDTVSENSLSIATIWNFIFQALF